MKPLSDDDIKKICELLDGWTDKLTWDSLIKQAEKLLLRKYTRQTFCKVTRIKNAFEHRKEQINSGIKKPKGSTPELQMVLDENARLKSENARLTMENTKLLEQFVIWATNAHNRNVTIDMLNQPLPIPDRGRTKE